MKWISVFFMLMAFHLLGAQDKAGVFGTGITGSTITPVSTILADAENFVGKTVVVEGQIVDVCAKRGCWMDLSSDKAFQKIRIKVTDGEIVFPLTAKGKTARAEGIVEGIKLSKEEALKYYEHQAEEKGETFDPLTVTGPVTIYRIKGTGATIQ